MLEVNNELKTIKFLDLQAINSSYEPALSAAVQRVVASGWYLLGQEAAQFERQYAAAVGAKHCIGVANGLDALRLILRAYIEIGEMDEGDEIIVPANTYIASILAITDNNLKAVFVETNVTNYNIDPLLIEEQITSRTRAIMVVHLYGQIGMDEEIERLSTKYKLKIIEDSAQSQLATYTNSNGDRLIAGNIGHAAGHSFYPGKNLGALGDAGAVTTNDDALGTVIRAIANYGSRKKYYAEFTGVNSRLDELQAAVLSVKLQRLEEDNAQRRKAAAYYDSRINNPHIILPKITGNGAVATAMSHVWHLYVIRTADRDSLQAHLAEAGIQTLIHYPVPPHKQQAYPLWNEMHLPITEGIHDQVLSLPIGPLIAEAELQRVVDAVNNYKQA
jgi:dTDP-4-amino-4,6-dideoxygalactose transaminase